MFFFSRNSSQLTTNEEFWLTAIPAQIRPHQRRSWMPVDVSRLALQKTSSRDEKEKEAMTHFFSFPAGGALCGWITFKHIRARKKTLFSVFVTTPIATLLFVASIAGSISIIKAAEPFFPHWLRARSSSQHKSCSTSISSLRTDQKKSQTAET